MKCGLAEDRAFSDEAPQRRRNVHDYSLLLELSKGMSKGETH